MNFADLRFWILLGAGLVLIVAARPLWSRLHPLRTRQIDLIALASLSFFLFFKADTLSCAILVIELSITFLVLRWCQRVGTLARTALISALILGQLSTLAYFKYSRFLFRDIFDLPVAVSDLAIPAGISFYTFQMIALVVDTIKNRLPLPSFLQLSTFTAFFPQIVAGPIERRATLLPQIEDFSFRLIPENIRRGLPILVLGLFYKLVLADNAAVFMRIENTTNPYVVLLSTLLFAFRIYFDFCGYSLIAVGIAACVGVELTYNFLAPYSSFNIREFWQRWHITLSTWLRDYLYRPLGGNRSGSWILNTALVFIASGIWHGAGFNFIIWGCIHGALMVAYGFYRRTELRTPRTVAWLATFVAVTLSWLPFYETDIARLKSKAITLFKVPGYGLDNLMEVPTLYTLGDRPTLLVTIAFCSIVLGMEFRFRGLSNPYAPLFNMRATTMLVAATILLAASGDSQFLYFAF